MSAVPASRFFRFREERYWSGSQPVVGIAAKEIVQAIVAAEEMGALFGGYVEYEDADGSRQYLGVWGDRKVARFLQLLRDRGATMEIEEAIPSEFRQRHHRSDRP